MSDNKALATFNIADAAEQLREKLKLAFVNMFTDEQWEALVADEWAKFSNRQPARDRWSKDAPSELSTICQGVLKEVIAEKTKQLLASDEWNTKCGTEIPEKIEQLLVEHREKMIDAMLTSMLGTAMGQMLAAVQDQLNSQSRGY